MEADEARPQHVAGQRIVPLVRVAADGAAELTGLFDTELGGPCFADVTTDGTYRTSRVTDDPGRAPHVVGAPLDPTVFETVTASAD